MRIPQSTSDTIIKAMQDFDLNKRDSEEWADWVQNKNHKFAILWADKIYPVKEIIRIATGFKAFSGGDGATAANLYIKSLGFDIVSLDDGYRLKKKRNPAWHRDELILGLDLYFCYHPSKINKNHKEVVALSAVLNSLPTHINRPDREKFRNPNGVYMKLGNFLRFDPSYKGKGLESGGKLEEEVWNEFADDREKLRSAVEFIRLGIEVDLIKAKMVEQPPEEIISAFNFTNENIVEKENLK